MHTLCRLSCKDDNTDNLVGKMSAGADLFVYMFTHEQVHICMHVDGWIDQ